MKKLVLVGLCLLALAIVVLSFDSTSESSLGLAFALIAANLLICLIGPLFCRRW